MNNLEFIITIRIIHKIKAYQIIIMMNNKQIHKDQMMKNQMMTIMMMMKYHQMNI